jgi:hypothetical protein
MEIMWYEAAYFKVVFEFHGGTEKYTENPSGQPVSDRDLVMIGNVRFLLSSSLCFPLFLITSLTVSTIIPLPPILGFCHEGLEKKKKV